MIPKVTYLSAKSPAIALNPVVLCSDMPQNAFEKPIDIPMMKGTERIDVRTVPHRSRWRDVSNGSEKGLSNQLTLKGQL